MWGVPPMKGVRGVLSTPLLAHGGQRGLKKGRHPRGCRPCCQPANASRRAGRLRRRAARAAWRRLGLALTVAALAALAAALPWRRGRLTAEYFAVIVILSFSRIARLSVGHSDGGS